MSRCYSRLAKAGLVTIAVALAVHCAAMWFNIADRQDIVGGQSLPSTTVEGSANFATAANVAAALSVVFGGLVFLWWFQCAYRRHARFRPTDSAPTSGWTSWLIPGPNLVRPPLMMIELTERTYLVAAWWALGIIGGITRLTLIAFRTETQQGLINWQIVAILANVLLIVAIACALSLISTANRLAGRTARFGVHPNRYHHA